MRRPLQQKIAVLLFVVICLSTLLVAVLALRGVAKAHDLAVQEVRHAVTTETLAQLQGFVQEKARRDELAFARVRSDARYLANFAAFIYDHPELFRMPSRVALLWSGRRRVIGKTTLTPRWACLYRGPCPGRRPVGAKSV